MERGKKSLCARAHPEVDLIATTDELQLVREIEEAKRDASCSIGLAVYLEEISLPAEPPQLGMDGLCSISLALVGLQGYVKS
jgi:hypothetical protein